MFLKRHATPHVATIIGPIVAMVFSAPITLALEIETFTEPYRQVDVPAAEMGVISEVHVRVGDRVTESQLLAKLDDRVLRASLKVAEVAMNAESEKSTAVAELTLREQQLRSYRELQKRGNASQREVDRAETSFVQANARMQTIEEQLTMRRLDYERTQAQLTHRSIQSPIDGVVVAVEKNAGEFVSPTDPVVLRVVQLKQLKAVFSVPLSGIEQMKAEERVNLYVGSQAEEVTGVIEWISPLVDADSNSVRVNVRIENPSNRYRAGVVCRWDLDASPPRLKSASHPTSSRRN